MQKTQSERIDNKLNENLSLISRKDLKLEGIVEVLATSDTLINLKLKDSPLTIIGTNISITKLDIDQGILEATGNFESIKYSKSAGFFKRLFK